MTGLAIGIDIGGTSVRAGIVDKRGQILASARAMTPNTVACTEQVLVDLVGELRRHHEVEAVGLAVAGFISADCQRVMFAPHLAWRDADVPARLAIRIGLPVSMDHDVNSAAWAEYTCGSAATPSAALLVALGTGIGTGLIVDGHIYRGGYGVAPELGHLTVVPGGRQCSCGKKGCWERYCSGTALARTAIELWQQAGCELPEGLASAEVTGTVVTRAARRDDRCALAATEELGRWLGYGLALAADVFDPEVIVIGGGVSAAADLYLRRAKTVFTESLTGAAHRPHARIRLAQFGDRAAVIGAASLARDRLASGSARMVHIAATG